MNHDINIMTYKLKFGIIRSDQLICKKCKIGLKFLNTYNMCNNCYQDSDDRKSAAKKCVENRPNYDGKNNPHYKGGPIRLECLCGSSFEVFLARKNTAKYCSRKCKKKYSISISKTYKYKGFNMRSSWEIAFAQYLDSKGYDWNHEPEAFETSYGFYTPDFWVKELNSYVEVKGFFRKDAKQKFDEFKQTHNIVLANKEYFESLGFIRIKSGPKKGQFICP